MWEMNASWMCSLIGTCLTLAELRRVQRRAKLTLIKPDISDYEIHVYFVNAASRNEDAARIMQKMLERKYALTWKKFALAGTAQELEKIWNDCLAEGDVAGPYWAVLAHPLSTPELKERAFGEVHMLSHLVGSTNRADIKTLRKTEIEIDKLREDYEKARCDIWSRDRIIAGLQRDLDDAQRRARNITFDVLDRNSGGATSDAPVKSLQTIAESLRGALNKADKINTSLQDTVARKSNRIEALEQERDRLKAELQAHEAEIRVLEAMPPMIAGDVCANDGGLCVGEAACPYDLCQKRVLYVGGRTTLVSRYRTVVEGWNGVFLHHDGGQEQGLERLEGMLDQADVVVFPVDCVSHTAVEHIKSHCRKSDEKYMMTVRSSGLGSFMRGLGDFLSNTNQALEGMGGFMRA